MYNNIDDLLQVIKLFHAIKNTVMHYISFHCIMTKKEHGAVAELQKKSPNNTSINIIVRYF